MNPRTVSNLGVAAKSLSARGDSSVPVGESRYACPLWWALNDNPHTVQLLNDTLDFGFQHRAMCLAPLPELAYGPDLKSGVCGFESHRGYAERRA